MKYQTALLFSLAFVLAPLAQAADSVIVGNGRGVPYEINSGSQDPGQLSGVISAENVTQSGDWVIVDAPYFHQTSGIIGGDYKIDANSTVGDLICASILPGSKEISQAKALFNYGFIRSNAYSAVIGSTGIEGSVGLTHSYLTQVTCGK